MVVVIKSNSVFFIQYVIHFPWCDAIKMFRISEATVAFAAAPCQLLHGREGIVTGSDLYF